VREEDALLDSLGRANLNFLHITHIYTHVITTFGRHKHFALLNKGQRVIGGECESRERVGKVSSAVIPTTRGDFFRGLHVLISGQLVEKFRKF
jgi:hypothetical protein